ncbi:MAG: beta strand repeat-containing protein, partial [Rhodospirillales bacterium]
VGAVQDSGGGLNYSGSVHLITFTNTSFAGGSLVGSIGSGFSAPGLNLTSNLNDNDFFGASVALSGDGTRLAVGSAQDDGSGVSGSANYGAVYLFSFANTSFGTPTLEGAIGRNYTGGKNADVASVLDSSDLFGISVAMNAVGDRLVVGASYDDGSGNTVTDAGALHLFTFSDTSFAGGTHARTMGAGYGVNSSNLNTGPALDFGEVFGSSVALSADGGRMAVGAPGDLGQGGVSGVNTGAVYLFTFTDTAFGGGALVGTVGKGYTGGKNVNVTDLVKGSDFGRSVALSSDGRRMAVGAPGDDSQSGAVYLFSFADTAFSTGTLTTKVGRSATVPVPSLDDNDEFGSSVALSADATRLAVGSWFDDGFGVPSSAVNRGAVRLFTFDNTSFGGANLALTIGDGYGTIPVGIDAGDRFGTSVALDASGTRLAVGAIADAGAFNDRANSGAVHLFTFAEPSGAFTGGMLAGTVGFGHGGINVTSLESGDNFGVSVALSADGRRLAVGAHQDGGAGNAFAGSGAVRLFKFPNTIFADGQLELTLGRGYTGGDNIDVTSVGANDFFGYSVALSGDGTRLAVGAPLDDGFADSRTDSGAVYLFVPGGGAPYPGDDLFENSPSSNVTFTPATLTALLNAGNAVTLQANNDITVSDPIVVVPSDAAGGALTLQAGRSILIDANITTGNGALSLIANDPGAVAGQRDEGPGGITMAAGTAIDTGTGAFTATAAGSGEVGPIT